jgi:hypothetical protein
MMRNRWKLQSAVHWLIALAGAVFCLAFWDSAGAQQDSVIIKDAQGNRGDTVSVPIIIANHSDSLLAIYLELAYDSNYVVADTMIPVGRAMFFPSAAPSPYGWAVTKRPGFIRLLAASWTTEKMPVGSDTAIVLKMRIKNLTPDGYYPITFSTADSQLNVFVGYGNATFPTITPVKITGNVIVGNITNSPPAFSNIPSTTQLAIPGTLLQFTVAATDVDNDSLTLSASGLPTGAAFATARGYRNVQSTFSFVAADSQIGHNYNVNFRVVDRYGHIVERQVPISVASAGNRPPTIGAVGAQIVTEGQRLQFTVSAYDLDGDFVTITASGLPSHSSFPDVTGDSTVSGTFTFDPDFNQGGNVYSVVFTARDALGSSSQITVDITVLDIPNDMLKFGDDQGALAGTSGRPIIINLTNAKPIYGLQFDFLYDPTILTIRSAYPSSRAQDMAFFSQQLAEDRYRVMVFSMGNETIAAGNDTIINFIVDIDSRAAFGPKQVTFDSATTVQDSVGTSKAVLFSPDTFTVDRLGDANLDGLVTVGDCVAIVASLLRRTTLNLRAADAADFNRDTQIRISDLMLVVNHILGRTILNPPLPLVAGNVELIRDGLAPGTRAWLPLWATLGHDAAGLQFAFDYDSSKVRFYGMEPGSLVSGMRVDYQDHGNRVIGVIYDLDLSVFGPGTGELVRMDMEAKSDNLDPKTAIRLTDFQLVDIDAQTLKIDIIGELPTSFNLQQNYPNPFNSSTAISFELPVSSFIKLSIYNVLGQNVNVLEDGYFEAGNHTVVWDGLDSEGNPMSSGVYFYRLQAKDFNDTKKMLLVK